MQIKTSVRENMQRVREASLGEVILFDQTNHKLLCTLLQNFRSAQFPVKGVQFHGVLGINEGIREEYPHRIIDEAGESIISEINSRFTYELALIDEGGVLVPFIRPPFGLPMCLNDNVYIGPDEISAVLSDRCDKHFELFFTDYIKAHRTV